MNKVMEELQARPYSLDPEYEYCSIKISFVRKEFFKQSAQDLKDGKITNEDPQAVSMFNFVNYVAELESEGWQFSHIINDLTAQEVRVYRRKIGFLG